MTDTIDELSKQAIEIGKRDMEIAALRSERNAYMEEHNKLALENDRLREVLEAILKETENVVTTRGKHDFWTLVTRARKVLGKE